MAKTELTQFSRIEFVSFRSSLPALAELEPGQLARAMTVREQAMYAFAKIDGKELARIDGLGGFENIQRIRVLREGGGAMSFEYALVKPLAMVLAERRRAKAKARWEARQKRAKAATPKNGERPGKKGAFAAAMRQRREKARHHQQPNVPIKMPRAEIIGRIELPKAA